MMLSSYLDYAATTPVEKQVAEKMSQYLTKEGIYGNASSSHVFGQKAKCAIDTARMQVADLIHADPSEIVWTSGATEANNLALKGAATLYKSKGKHIITLKTEHLSVLDCCQQLEKEGFLVTYLTPGSTGRINIEEFHAALREDTILVSIMHVNNEMGVIQDISAIAQMTSARGILLHVDAAQSAGKLPIDVMNIPVDLMSFSAHKIYGPKGIGALFVRKKPRVRVAPQLHGGGQEQGMRSGTLPTHQIVGMGEAFALAKQFMKKDQETVTRLRQHFLSCIEGKKNIILNGDPDYTIPNILNLRLIGMKADTFINQVPDVAVSVGSACLSSGQASSYVLRALGQTEEEARSAIRFSFGRFTTINEIDFVTSALKRIVV